MQKKYIQLLLSMNFCLMAVAATANSEDKIGNSTLEKIGRPTPQITSPLTENNQNFSTDPYSMDNYVPPSKISEAHLDWEDEKDHFPISKISEAPDDYVYAENFVPPPLISEAPYEDEDLDYEEDHAVEDTTPDSAFSMDADLSTQFYHIFHRLEKINEIYPSEALQRFISESQHPPVQYNESKLQKDLTQDITAQTNRLCSELEVLSNYEFKKKPDKKIKAILHTQFREIHDCLDRIRDLYKTKRSLSKNDQLFLNYLLGELLVLSQDFLKEEELVQETLSLAKREADSTPESSPSPTRIELDNQFNQIWSCLDEMNAIHQSELLQRPLSYYRNEEIPYNDNPDEVSEETLENQFIQLHKALEICSQYQPKEELDEDSKAKLGIQLDQIKQSLGTIHEIYRKKSLSKEEKVFLRDELQRLHNFSYHFITENSPQEDNTDIFGFLGGIQMLLNSCEEEDSLLYPQYEYIMNNQETNISDLLTNSQAENNIQSSLLYFNKEEGLIELQHIELLDDGKTDTSLYTTTWKIRSADANLVNDWKENNVINIDKTSIFSRYTMFGESLEYTLTNTNHNKSVRANFVCKSSNQNTYTILSIDYLENIVVLENGPCLFVQEGDLKEWHVKDIVVLQRHGPVTNTNHSHQLINKIRNNKEIRVFVKK